ncbi:hypothetical protein [Streptomyces sp. NPDC102476]|uniref:hypothetical protein n=1 Tax=Streptomyces sp. NPDC102476 TaxID=3366181 RepID=UPI003809CD79
MDIRPQDLPELRTEMIRQRHQVGDKAIGELHRHDTVVADWFGLNAQQVAHIETNKLAHATLFHVSREMTELAIEASRTLPGFGADAQDFPAEVGLIFFNGGIPASWGGYPVRIHAASWQALEDCAEYAFFLDTASVLSIIEGKGDHLREAFHIDASSTEGLWFNDVTRSVLMFCEGVDEDQADRLRDQAGEVRGPAGEAGVTSTGLHALRSALLLMQQPLAEASEAQPDRAARKRLLRAGQNPAVVRVIELRQPSKSASGTADGSGREYHHRWITRGHWRNHWHPKRQIHRPVWIAPHIKGPEGAPLIGGEKVYALKR